MEHVNMDFILHVIWGAVAGTSIISALFTYLYHKENNADACLWLAIGGIFLPITLGVIAFGLTLIIPAVLLAKLRAIVQARLESKDG